MPDDAAEAGAWSTGVIVIALLRREQAMLMVQQHEPFLPDPVWVLPGGKVEAGETLMDAVVREEAEETGLRVLQCGSLIYTMQTLRTTNRRQWLTFVYDVPFWEGAIKADDPDADILDVAFVPLEEAIQRLEQLPWDAVSRPLAEYLHGKQPAGVTWVLAEDMQGNKSVTVYPPGEQV